MSISSSNEAAALAADKQRSMAGYSEEAPPAQGSRDGVRLAQIETQADDQDNQRKLTVADTKPLANNDSSSSSSLRSKKSVNCDDTKGTKQTDISAGSPKNGSALSARRPSTTSRFKEKRPEPLKLNSNLNQDIPLDLSVKSAGNVPSGTLGSVFNLGQINPSAPLETPRIQWQDNDALLTSTKNRLFSSSTIASNRARISSFIGESPPITPNTPLMDAMFSSINSASCLRLLNEPPHSASFALESPFHSILSSPYLPNKHLLDYQQMRSDMRVAPRRSCSTDNLHLFLNGNYNQSIADILTSPNKVRFRQDDKVGQQSPNNLGISSKKNSISPLATKSLSSGVSSPTKFPYTNQPIAINNNDPHSPTSNGKSITPTSVANATLNLFNIHLNSPNSNSRQSPINPIAAQNKLIQEQQYKSPSFSSTDHDPCLTEVSTSMTYIQQNVRRHLAFPTSNGLDVNNNNTNSKHQQMLQLQNQQSNASISSTATLNTPTLISPSQMKAGQLCFLHSPTLSPMSSVFDLPSPFLMFAQPSSSSSTQITGQHQPWSASHNENKAGSSAAAQSPANPKNVDGKKVKYDGGQNDRDLAQDSSLEQDKKISPKTEDYVDDTSDTLKSRSDGEFKQAFSSQSISGKNDLSRLITSAEQKSSSSKTENGKGDNLNDVIDMDVDGTSVRQTASGNVPNQHYDFSDDPRPSTVIPQICISNHHAKSSSSLQQSRVKSNRSLVQISNNELLVADRDGSYRQREQRDVTCKRSLSPQTFHARVKNYQIERLESCSAPPDVHQRRRRSKIKTANIADSCFELADNVAPDKTNRFTTNAPQNKPASQTQSAADLNTSQNARNSYRPYPEMRSWLTVSNQQLENKTNNNSFLNGRSSSAEPAVFPVENFEQKSLVGPPPPPPTNNNLENASVLSCQSADHLYSGHCNQHYHQQHQPPPTLPLESTHRFQSPSQPVVLHQQQYHSHQSNQQFHYQQQTLSYDQQYNTQQLYSMSTGDLHRLQYSRNGCSQMSSTNVLTSKNEPNVFAPNVMPYNTQQMVGLGQNFSSSSSQLEGHRFHRASDQNSFERTPTARSAAYQLDMESRPESRSSCSLDFTSAFSGSNGSRSNSSASTNLAAKKYHCDQCSKSFTRSDMLTRHRRLHSGDRPFQCTECKQEFSRSDHLSTHMRTHTGEKPYKCKLCTYSACRKDMITRHLKVHNRGGPSQPFMN